MEKKNTLVITILAVVVLLVLVLTATFAYFAANVQGIGNQGNITIVNATLPSSDTTFIVEKSGIIDLVVTAGDMIYQVADNSTAKQTDDENITIKLTGGAASSDGIVACHYDLVFEWDTGSGIDTYVPTPGLVTGDKEFTLEIGNATQSGDCKVVGSTITPVDSDKQVCSNGFVPETNIASTSTLTGLVPVGSSKTTLLTNQIINSAGSGSTVIIPVKAKIYNVSLDQSELGSDHYKGRVYVDNVEC